MVSLMEAVILSIVQGITEWFPISSSGHLALMQSFFGYQNLSYDIFLHFAGIFAVLIVFRREILDLFKFDENSIRYLVLLIIAMIPAGLVGLFLSDWIEGLFSNMKFLGMFFILSGIVVYSTKFSSEYKGSINNNDALVVGLLQSLAILPGVSRSGMTISAGLHRGISKKAAIRFSFLMSIPLILGASVLKAKDLVVSSIDWNILIVSFFVTFLVSLFTIKKLIQIINGDKFYLFGVYNVILGVLVLIMNS